MIIGCKTTEANLPLMFMRTLNGIYGLTEKELELAAAIIARYKHYEIQGLKEPFLSKFVFSTEERKFLCDTLDGLSSQNLGNRFKQLVDKRVLVQSDSGYSLNPNLFLKLEVIFKFIIVDDKPGEAVQENS
jgi:hypothetical protein